MGEGSRMKREREKRDDKRESGERSRMKRERREMIKEKVGKGVE